MNNIEERLKSRSNKVLALTGIALIASIFTLNSWILFISLLLFIVTVAHNMCKIINSADMHNGKSDIAIIITFVGILIVVAQLCVMFYIINEETPLIEIIKSFSINGLIIYCAKEIITDSMKNIGKILFTHKDKEKN